jgi:hypothetical protein
LQYGLELDADVAVGMGGPVNFAPEFNGYLRWAPVADPLWRAHASARFDVREAYAAKHHSTRALLVYSDQFWDDRLHASSLRGVPSITVLPVANCDDHNSMLSVISRGWLDTLLEWMMAPDRVTLPSDIPDAA